MHFFTVILLLSPALAFCASVTSTSSATSFVDISNCNTILHSDTTGTKTEEKKCLFKASLQIGKDSECTISYYEKLDVTTTTGIVPPNNGVAICTQQPCDKSTEPVIIDCKEAFGSSLVLIGKNINRF